MSGGRELGTLDERQVAAGLRSLADVVGGPAPDGAPAFYLGAFRTEVVPCDNFRCLRTTTIRLLFIHRGTLVGICLCPRCIETAIPVLRRGCAR